MVTGFVKLNGMTVGAVANCSTVYDAEGKKAEEFALSLTAKGCNKAAEFVSFCDAFLNSCTYTYKRKRIQELHVL